MQTLSINFTSMQLESTFILVWQHPRWTWQRPSVSKSLVCWTTMWMDHRRRMQCIVVCPFFSFTKTCKLAQGGQQANLNQTFVALVIPVRSWPTDELVFSTNLSHCLTLLHHLRSTQLVNMWAHHKIGCMIHCTISRIGMLHKGWCRFCICAVWLHRTKGCTWEWTDLHVLVDLIWWHNCPVSTNFIFGFFFFR